MYYRNLKTTLGHLSPELLTSQGFGVCMVGLHCCGPLSPNILHLYAHQDMHPSIKVCVLVISPCSPTLITHTFKGYHPVHPVTHSLYSDHLKVSPCLPTPSTLTTFK